MNIRWTNNSLAVVDSIPLLFYGQPHDSVVRQVKVGGKDARLVYMDKNGNTDGFYVATPRLMPGKSVSIDIAFRTYEADFFRDNILFFEEDMPVVPYCDAKGFDLKKRVHSDYEAVITVPGRYNVATTGVVSFESATDFKKTLTTWAADVPWFGIVMLWDEILSMESRAAGVAVKTFYFPQDSLWAQKLTRYAEDIIQFYTAELGFFPSQAVTIISGYDRPYGVWPVCPGVVGIHIGLDRKPEDHAHWITAHELAHQYWGYNYTMSPIGYPEWLGIALGIYTDRIYSRHAGIGIDYDAYFYEDYIDAVEAGINTTIMRPVAELDGEDIDWNNIIVHGKGWAVVRLLEYELGQEVFREAYDLYLQRSAGRNLSVDEFRMVCEEVSGRSLSEFFRTWLHTDAYLGYETFYALTWEEEDEYRIVVGIDKTGTATVGSLEVAFGSSAEGGRSQVVKYDTGGGAATITIDELLPFQPETVEIDPAGKLPLVGREGPRKVLVRAAGVPGIGDDAAVGG